MQFIKSRNSKEVSNLKKEIASLAKNAIRYEGKKPVVAGILPHAGIKYSGRGISNFFSNIDKTVENLIILAPSHFYSLEKDNLYFSDHSSIDTIFGKLDVIKGENNRSKFFKIDYDAMLNEHSIETLLPFVKYYGIKRVCPIIVSQITSKSIFKDIRDELINFLNNNVDMSKTLIIASSDFSHYGRRFEWAPFGIKDLYAVYYQVKKMDFEYAEMICSNKIGRALKKFNKEKPTICGFYSMLLLSSLAKVYKWDGKVIDYYTTNNITNENNLDFVSFCSILFEET